MISSTSITHRNTPRPRSQSQQSSNRQTPSTTRLVHRTNSLQVNVVSPNLPFQPTTASLLGINRQVYDLDDHVGNLQRLADACDHSSLWHGNFAKAVHAAEASLQTLEAVRRKLNPQTQLAQSVSKAVEWGTQTLRSMVTS